MVKSKAFGFYPGYLMVNFTKVNYCLPVKKCLEAIIKWTEKDPKKFSTIHIFITAFLVQTIFDPKVILKGLF